MNMIRRILIVMLITSLSSCQTPSFFKKQDRKYLHARSIQPLTIPSGLTGEGIASDFPVSQNVPPPSNEISIVPPGL